MVAIASANAQESSTAFKLKGTLVQSDHDINDPGPAYAGSFFRRVKCSSDVEGVVRGASYRDVSLSGCPGMCIDHIYFDGREGQSRTDDGSNATYKDGLGFSGVATANVVQGTVVGAVQSTATGFPDPRTERGTITFTYKAIFGNTVYLCSFAGTYKAKY